jgi:hypothetical protein
MYAMQICQVHDLVIGYNAALEAAEAEISTAAHVALDEALGTIGDEVQEVQV